MIRAWKEWPNTPPSMDKPQNISAASPGYETRDANVRGVFNFLVFLAVLLVAAALLSWGLFRYFSRQQAASAVASPFENTRQLPLGPQLQVNPREDLLRYEEEQKQSLETYEWENRGAGIVRVPIERAMDLLVQKGLPVQGASAPQADSAVGKTAARGREKIRAGRGKETMKTKTASAIYVLFVMIAALPARAQQANKPPILNEVSIAQNLNAQIPRDLVFRDETGKSVRLGDFFGPRPVVLSLVYFECPALCTEVLNGELQSMKSISLDLGKDYEAVTVSFEPKDTSALAKAKRDVYAGQYGRAGAVDHWHFLTGDQPSIDALTQAVGFHYAYDSAGRQYAHAAAIMVLTPEGRIDRYFYGVQYPAWDLRLGLVEASQGKIGTPTDHALLYCYQYDPTTGKYGLVVMNVVRVAGGLTLLVLGIFMFLMFRRDHRLAGVPPDGGVKVR